MNKYSVAEIINTEVNTSVTYKSDLEQYGEREYWSEAGRFGDCEDYALLKKRKLIEQGFDKSGLHLACCWVETWEYHCVLLVETDKGVFVLDNRHAWPKVPGDLPYKWHKAWQDGVWREISF